MYDAIIIGAGPAGSVTAATVAKAGYRTLILEKNSRCRSPCAGYINSTINMEIPAGDFIQSKITKMRTYLPDSSFHDFVLNGFVVDRPSFDMSLAMKANDAGAQIKWDAPLTGLVPGSVKFRGGDAKGKIIVGADGVFSRTASFLGLKKQKIAVCAQYRLKGIKPLHDTAEIFFNTDYAPGGYAWIYPAGKDSAKVGVGVTGTKSPRMYLESFIRQSGVADRLGGRMPDSRTPDSRMPDSRIIEYITGALPVGGLREKLCFGNVLLAGDSAGMADPITGAGINNALLAGEIAGKTIVEALENDDMTLLPRYESKIKKLLGRPLSRSLEKRKKLECCQNNEILQQHLPGLWVTFREYWD
ncbi:MAG: NAD(P)/FAD-dependent oxidoreductase [Candidatus Methanoperedens sp.]|nr:NAD(P)/FAD-dependent oxidoreductase [Candidatus Methanoperedens sp.]